MKTGPTLEHAQAEIRGVRATLAKAAVDFASALAIDLPTEHSAECPSFCGGQEQHALGAISRTLLDISELQAALSDGTRACSSVIGTTQLAKMAAALSGEKPDAAPPT